MKKKSFSKLAASIKEAGTIKRCSSKAGRVYRFKTRTKLSGLKVR